MYQYAKEKLGITMITCSHRPGLKKYHNYILRLDGEKNATFGPITKDDLDRDNNLQN